jgi:hypothetical protein
MFLLIALAAASAPGIAQQGIEVPNAIAKQHNAYVRCQDEHFDIRNVSDQQTLAKEVEKSIAACKDQKAVLIGEAEKILATAPEYGDPTKRKSAIAQSFDGYDQMRREMASGDAAR